MKRTIKELRERAKLTQEELADLSGVGKLSVYRSENLIGISEGTIARLCQALNVPRNDVFVASTDWRLHSVK